MASDLPPPYTALTRHPMMPRTSHNEAARFNFLTHFNRYLSGEIGSGNKLAYDKQVLPRISALSMAAIQSTAMKSAMR